MKIIQMVTTLSYGDAIGNNIIALRDTLLQNGYETEIYAALIDTRVDQSIVKPIDTYVPDENNIILYHFAINSEWNTKIIPFKEKLIVIYHNVTPAHYFEEYNPDFCVYLNEAREQLRELLKRADLCIADSEYNKQDLINEGCTCDIIVLPIVIRFQDYEKEPNQEIIRAYKEDGITNILFTGRIAPNKKIENVIRCFYYYNKYINADSRLILAGAYQLYDPYYRRLLAYTRRLKLDVLFTGHIPFADLLSYFHTADLFLCMSEHEGFCVPLVEAMYFNIPIVAYDTTAVGETMGEAGIVLDTNDPKVVSEVMNQVLTDEKLRNRILEQQKHRLTYFNNDRIKENFLAIINNAVKK